MKGNKKPHIREVICLVLEVGLEPTKPKARDLQSPVIATTRFQLVEPLPGFEPGTYCLQNSCSNQLS